VIRQSNYLLASSTEEMQRLRLQAQVWEAAANEFLAGLDIRPGSRVLDLMARSFWFAYWRADGARAVSRTFA
jgi:hypothetical protein